MNLTNKQKLELRKIAKDNDLKFIIVFGSFANSQNKKDSDLDISVLQDVNSKKKLNFLKIYNPLAQIFNKHDVDLSFLNKKDALFLFEVARNSKLIYGNEDSYAEFKAYAFRRYMDEDSIFKLKDKLLKKQQKLLKSQIYA